VILFFRKSVPHFFSIENVFFAVADQLQLEVPIKKVFLPYHTSSIRNVIRNLFFAHNQRDSVYHVTGDVHYLVLALPGRKSILTIHDCVFLHRHHGFKKWFLQRLFLTWPVKHSRVITTISENSKREIIKYSGCSPEKIRVINNPVTQHIYYKRKDFNSTKPVLLFLGSTPNKNLARAIEAIKGVNCLLHIVGIIPPEEELRLKENQIDYVASVNLSEKELADAFYNADLLFFPTLYEGFGLPIVEAQKAGRAVLTSDLSPMKEVAGPGACLVDPSSIQSIRDGMLKIINDHQYRNALVQKGFDNVKRFEVDQIAAQYLKIYKEVIGKLPEMTIPAD
jgi:glycosyltransferase involved in cell wall biosynthesis